MEDTVPTADSALIVKHHATGLTPSPLRMATGKAQHVVDNFSFITIENQRSRLRRPKSSLTDTSILQFKEHELQRQPSLDNEEVLTVRKRRDRDIPSPLLFRRDSLVPPFSRPSCTQVDTNTIQESTPPRLTSKPNSVPHGMPISHHSTVTQSATTDHISPAPHRHASHKEHSHVSDGLRQSIERRRRIVTDSILSKKPLSFPSPVTSQQHSIAQKLISRIRHKRTEHALPLAGANDGGTPSKRDRDRHHLEQETLTNLSRGNVLPFKPDPKRPHHSIWHDRSDASGLAQASVQSSITKQDIEKSSVSHVSFNRSLSKPYGIAVLSAKLRLLPVFDGTFSEGGKSVYIAAQFEACLRAVNRNPQPGAALDFVTIIDNSAECSPASLMAHCETVRLLASLLDPEKDRLGVICFANCSATPDVALPLSEPKLALVKAALDNIVPSQNAVEASRMGSLLETAQRILLEQSHECEVAVSATYGHICLLTSASPDSSFSHFEKDERLTIHLLCASPLPPGYEQWPETNGWKLRSFSGREPRPVRRVKPEFGDDRFGSGLRDLVVHARTGQSPGRLTNVKWTFQPGRDIEIRDILGRTELEALQPGEVQQLILAIRCKNITTASSRASTQSPPTDRVDEAIEEIEQMLNGFPTTHMMEAVVRYGHSSLSDDVLCINCRSCFVRRCVESPMAAKYGAKPAETSKRDNYAEVQRQLASHIFSLHDGEKAMAALQKMIDNGHGRLACPEYVSLLMKERRYISRSSERRAASEHITSREPLRLANLNLQPELSDHVNQRTPIQSPLGAASFVENVEPASDGSKGDAARGIWNDIRLRSKPSKGGTRNSNSGQGGSVKEMRALIELALKNKRSLSEDTIRSLSLKSERMKVRGAPWL